MRPCFPVNKCLSLAVTSRRGSTSFIRALISPSAGFLSWSLGWFRTEEVWSKASLSLSPPRSPPSSPPVLSSACLSSGSEGSVLMALSPPHLIITGPREESVSNFMSHPCVWVLSHFSCVWLFVTPWTAAHQAPLSMGFSLQEHWSGLPCPPPGDLPDPGIEPVSSVLQVDSLLLSHRGSPSHPLTPSNPNQTHHFIQM